ncbi:MAG: LLM class flavin-dependent oxidoreductase [Myxococcota bacterium]|nr:LLM class flavin-dependent oxidoreductase [Myxococcota bacterium]
MKIATGLPNAVPGTPGARLVEWARRAEAAGFSSLGTIGRVVFDCHEELVALAAAAGATRRIGLVTTVLIGPVRDPVMLAKQAATLDAVSDGRFVLGLGVGWRADDYEATGRDFERRGEALDAMIPRMRAIWRGEEEPAGGRVGPEAARPEGPPVLVGGNVPAALRRAGRLADRFLAPPLPPDAMREQHAIVAEAARDAGRPTPPLLGARYVALGEDVRRRALDAMAAYYAAGGEDFVRTMQENLVTTAEGVREAVKGIADTGAEELFLWPAADDPEQVERIAEAAGL